MLLWSKHADQYHELSEAIRTVVRMARDGEELPDVTAADLVKVIASIKKDIALGPDHLSPRELRRLPPGGVEALLQLYLTMEKGICVPEVFKQACLAWKATTWWGATYCLTPDVVPCMDAALQGVGH